jgi:hypothetical protein
VTRNKPPEPLTVEKLAVDCLDARELQRAKAFKNQWVVLSMAEFRWPFVSKMRVARYLIHLEFHNRAVPQQIRVSWTRCFFGNGRPWLHCPFCDRRVARLFRAIPGFSCRVCIGAIYESQRRSKNARAYLQAHRLRQQLGGSRPMLDPIPERPYRMKQKTYRRLCAKITGLELPLIGSRITREPIYIPPLSY